MSNVIQFRSLRKPQQYASEGFNSTLMLYLRADRTAFFIQSHELDIADLANECDLHAEDVIDFLHGHIDAISREDFSNLERAVFSRMPQYGTQFKQQ